LREAGRESVHLRSRLFEGLPFREARDNSEEARPSIVLRRVPPERAPHLGLPRITEPGGSDADDDVLPSIEKNGAAHKASIGAVSTLPQVVADDHHRLGAIAILARCECPSFDGIDPEHGEEVVGHVGGRDALRFPIVPGEVDIRVPPAGDVLEGRELFPEIRELDGRDVAIGLSLSVVHLAEGDETIGIGVRQGPQEQRVDGAYDRDGGADAESERERRGHRETGALSEESEAESEVAGKLHDCGPPINGKNLAQKPRRKEARAQRCKRLTSRGRPALCARGQSR
jgi:hypothetical protein